MGGLSDLLGVIKKVADTALTTEESPKDKRSSATKATARAIDALIYVQEALEVYDRVVEKAAPMAAKAVSAVADLVDTVKPIAAQLDAATADVQQRAKEFFNGAAQPQPTPKTKSVKPKTTSKAKKPKAKKPKAKKLSKAR